MEAGVRSAVSRGEQAWRNHYSWTEHELREYSENINAAFQSERQRTRVYYLTFLYFKQYGPPPNVNIMYYCTHTMSDKLTIKYVESVMLLIFADPCEWAYGICGVP